MNWRRPLDTVLGRQPLLERNWELVRKLCPSLISHLGFEPVQDFVKHVLQFRMRVLPRGDGVTKVDEVLHHSCWINGDHVAHSPECRVLFVVVPNVSQASAPRSDELVETGRHLIGTHQTHPPDGDGSVLQQSLGRVGTVDDGDQGLEQDRDVVFHIRTKLHRYLSDCPGGVVTDRDVLCVEIPGQDWHKLWYARVDVGKTCFGEVSQKGERGLPDLWHWVLDTLEKQLHDV